MVHVFGQYNAELGADERTCTEPPPTYASTVTVLVHRRTVEFEDGDACCLSCGETFFDAPEAL